MEFTKVGFVYMDMDDIQDVIDDGPRSGAVTVVFRGGGQCTFTNADAHAIRALLADKVKEELPLPPRDEG